MNPTTVKRVAVRTALASLLAFPCVLLAATQAIPQSDEAVMRQATSVVVGVFTGSSSTRIHTYDHMLDEDGRPTSYQGVVSTFPFEVWEVLDGPMVPDTLELNVVGGEHGGLNTPIGANIPEPWTRVVIGVLEDNKSGSGAYLITHGRVFAANEDEALQTLREQVAHARVPYDDYDVAWDVELEDAWQRDADEDQNPPPARNTLSRAPTTAGARTRENSSANAFEAIVPPKADLAAGALVSQGQPQSTRTRDDTLSLWVICGLILAGGVVLSGVARRIRR